MSLFGASSVRGFLRTEGMKFVNEENEQVILEGYGAGNWQNPEGFMCGSPIPLFETIAGYESKVVKPLVFDRKRTMNQVITDLAGASYASTFWSRWEKNHLQEADIEAMSAAGLNSVRLVLNAEFYLPEEPGLNWNEESFEHLSEILSWCEKHHIYAILDLHAAPGGQSALACDAGYDTRPRMFYEKESRDRALALWEQFAKRFSKRWIVAGYELLNEPLSSPLDIDNLSMLGKFYDDCIKRIRRHDKKHIIFIAGAFYSTDCSLYDHDFDPECHNWAVTFHKYGYSPEKNEIYPYLEKALEWNVPIWMSEGGSDPETNSVFFNIVKDFGVGVNLWCWKSAINEGRENRCVGHKLPKNWKKVQDYILGSGDRPTYKESAKIFDEMLENLKYERCLKNFTPIHTSLRHVPFDLSAVGYDNTPGSFVSGWTYGNILNYRTEDGTKLVFDNNLPHPVITGHLKLGRGPGAAPANTNPLQALLLELNKDEYAVYTVRTAPKGSKLVVEGRSPGGAELTISCEDAVLGTVKLPRSQKAMKLTEALDIPQGEMLKIKITVTKGKAQLKKLHFTL